MYINKFMYEYDNMSTYTLSGMNDNQDQHGTTRMLAGASDSTPGESRKAPEPSPTAQVGEDFADFKACWHEQCALPCLANPKVRAQELTGSNNSCCCSV